MSGQMRAAWRVSRLPATERIQTSYVPLSRSWVTSAYRKLSFRIYFKLLYVSSEDRRQSNDYDKLSFNSLHSHITRINIVSNKNKVKLVLC